MHIFGLTGSIGMGKSTAANLLRQMGYAVHDADATVHRLLGPRGKAVAKIATLWPACLQDAGPRAYIDRKSLGAQVFADPKALHQLEAILHPLVKQDRQQFLVRQWRQNRDRPVFLDIPLLYETGGQEDCDAVLVVDAPDFLQQKRVLRRPGMLPTRFAQIKAKQYPNQLKRKLADAVIPSGLGRAVTGARLRAAIRRLQQRPALAWLHKAPKSPIKKKAARGPHA